MPVKQAITGNGDSFGIAWQLLGAIAYNATTYFSFIAATGEIFFGGKTAKRQGAKGAMIGKGGQGAPCPYPDMCGGS